MRKWIATIGLVLLTAAPLSAARADGKELFEKNCSKCHGMTGLGDTKAGKAAKAKKFQGDEKVMGDDAKVADTVLKTVRDPEKKKHREVSKKVSDADLQTIAIYIKALATAPPAP